MMAASDQSDSIRPSNSASSSSSNDPPALPPARPAPAAAATAVLGEVKLASPSDLTPELITKLLRSCPHYSSSLTSASAITAANSSRSTSAGVSVSSISIRDVEEGVLSHVVDVSLTYSHVAAGDNEQSSQSHSDTQSCIHHPNLLPPAGLIIKFLRPQSPQRRMFATEGTFYTSSKYATLRSTLPFGIPNAIYVSPKCIVLERIDVGIDVGRDDSGGGRLVHRRLVEGCRPGLELDGLVKLLATFHARAWVGCSNNNNSKDSGSSNKSSSRDAETDTAEERYADLDPTPGVGMAMSGLTKERLFAARWEEYLDSLFKVGYGSDSVSGIESGSDSDSGNGSGSGGASGGDAGNGSGEGGIITKEQHAKLTVLCRTLSKVRLRDVHDRIVSFRPTLIHGDFHVANLLLSSPTDGPSANENNVGECDEEEGKASQQCHNHAPYLIDWATCGAGNPLFDLTFFLLVSTPNGGEDSLETDRILKIYYDTLTDPSNSDGDIANNIAYHLPTYEHLLEMYRTCVLNEFLILVVYDRLARQFVDAAAETSAKREERARHFGNVARRCVRAVLSDLVHVERYDLPPSKTMDDLNEEAEVIGRGDDSLGMEL